MQMTVLYILSLAVENLVRVKWQQFNKNLRKKLMLLTKTRNNKYTDVTVSALQGVPSERVQVP